MREIKFRAWDNGYMHYSNRQPDKTEHYHNDFSVVVSLTGYCYVIENNGDCNDKIVALSEDAIPMQFTGLKDKNGKEIYEGDVIKWQEDGFYLAKTNDYEKHDTIGIVGFNKGEFTRDNIRSLTKRKSLSEGKSVQLWPFIKNDIEVIGNIYETPDLITKP